MAELRVSKTKYLRPLLPPGAIFHSHCKSNCANSPVEIISPPCWPSPASQPSSTAHPCAGKVCLLKLLQPEVLLPSKRSFQCCALSLAASWFGTSAARTELKVGSSNNAEVTWVINALITLKESQQS